MRSKFQQVRQQRIKLIESGETIATPDCECTKPNSRGMKIVGLGRERGK